VWLTTLSPLAPYGAYTGLLEFLLVLLCELTPDGCVFYKLGGFPAGGPPGLELFGSDFSGGALFDLSGLVIFK